MGGQNNPEICLPNTWMFPSANFCGRSIFVLHSPKAEQVLLQSRNLSTHKQVMKLRQWNSLCAEFNEVWVEFILISQSHRFQIRVGVGTWKSIKPTKPPPPSSIDGSVFR